MNALICPACSVKVRLKELRPHPPEQPNLSRVMNRRFCPNCGCELALRERSGAALVLVVLVLFASFVVVLFVFDPSDMVKLTLSLIIPGALFLWSALGKRLVKVRD
jgi:hypothetical protein